MATSTGPSAVNISYSANVSQWAIELIADSFTTGSTLPWALVTSGGSSNPSCKLGIVAGSESSGPLTSSIGGRPKKSLQPPPHPLRDSPPASPQMATVSFSTAGWLLRRRTLRRAANRRPTFRQRSESSSRPAARPGGAVRAGTAVTITGTNFAAGDTVAFGGSAATGVVVNSATSITANAPAGNASKVGGTVDVTVTGPGGTSPASPADEFTYLVSSSTYSISLAASTTAPAVGASVTLTATANKDIGPTPYGMSIVDASTGVIVSHVGSGSTFMPPCLSPRP